MESKLDVTGRPGLRLTVVAGDEYPGPEIAVREGETASAVVRLPVAIRP